MVQLRTNSGQTSNELRPNVEQTLAQLWTNFSPTTNKLQPNYKQTSAQLQMNFSPTWNELQANFEQTASQLRAKFTKYELHMHLCHISMHYTSIPSTLAWILFENSHLNHPHKRIWKQTTAFAHPSKSEPVASLSPYRMRTNHGLCPVFPTMCVSWQPIQLHLHKNSVFRKELPRYHLSKR